jgi:hypothetical protein
MPFYRFFTWMLIALAALMAGCQSSDGARDANNRPLARVHNKMLYLSDLEGMIPTETSPEDSAVIIAAYVERWIREAALMDEAERNVPKDLNIDKLVRDYRASLIRHSYEKTLVEQMLDSTVTKEQLERFYESNKEQFPLQTDVARCRFVSLPRNAPELAEFEKWWKSDKQEDYQTLIAYCSSNAVASLLDDSIWYSLPDLEARWPGPAGELINTPLGRKLSRRDDNMIYYIQINEIIRQKELAPMGFIENQLKKVLIHQRKMSLFDQTREEIYQDALKRKQVQVFLK